MSNIATGLTGEDIEFGKKLWRMLRADSRFPVCGMFWLLEGEWHLVIASDIVDKLGPRDAYEELDKTIPFDPSEASQMLRIDLISPKSPLYVAFRNLWTHTPEDRVEGRRLSSSQVAGMYVDDVYFYGVH
ncbi:MAG TPA: hypothetical protein VND65_19115 [Candidatus Binatia bacterium]|nr:hypothetical protein [Candidatus Binatia bacterium]